jgi:hypothetical protein
MNQFPPIPPHSDRFYQIVLNDIESQTVPENYVVPASPCLIVPVSLDDVRGSHMASSCNRNLQLACCPSLMLTKSSPSRMWVVSARSSVGLVWHNLSSRRPTFRTLTDSLSFHPSSRVFHFYLLSYFRRGLRNLVFFDPACRYTPHRCYASLIQYRIYVEGNFRASLLPVLFLSSKLFNTRCNSLSQF